ncbi:DNA gyrase/topoisomerase IV subunit A [Raineyella fluvialis]|uniref:DNA topoisomerase (ATP-hydrolyzing) n=1 Tax=Raineyella fluvialis TaxID=2662261 RepID=A0A5Q2FCH4_9ACTN|nr:DNA topoisomerase IV subunit A [Raineyella fluvialis]QGF24780.1 DNA topoisomerase 4 subunit A [Raineyella fluvialis]
MARRSTTVDEEEFEEHVIDVDVSDEMQSSFLEYAYSVIYARALPDARDGLKPVQRRILYSMNEMGLRPDRAHVKCARVVGEVMGKYHPHGDSAIYDALVRLGQPWAMRLPMVDSHGNFGSLDAGPAAMRYTECRMAPAALTMTDGLDLDTVDFRPNYDGHETEPAVLPASFPNLLVNGSTGIAVGMATNIPPHNLIEVVHALRHLLAHPEADLDAVMRFIPGPDFASGGTIVGLEGIRDAYETGRGTFRIRAKARIEQISARRQGIVVTELPPMIGPEKIIEQIKVLVQSKKLQGVSDVKDLSDLQHPTRLVIEVKNGFHPEALLEQLYRRTKLEDSFGINTVALVDGQPRTLSLIEALQVYLEHRLEVTLRRSLYQRARAEERLHLVEGLLIAILDIDDVIAIVRRSEDAGEAKAALIEAFDLSDVQATYILDMQLRRLTRYSRLELEGERDELTTRIAALTEIIESDEKLRGLVGDELAAVATAHGDARRTVLLSSAGVSTAAAAPIEVADEPCWVIASATGLLARTSDASPLPGAGPRTGHDVLAAVVRTTARSQIGVVTSTGLVHKLSALDLPVLPRTASAPHLQGGSQLSELLPLEPGEELRALVPLDPDSPGLAIGTRQGVVKVVRPEILGRSEWEVIRLDAGDEVAGAVWLGGLPGAELCFITSDAQLLHFPLDAVRPQGRTGGGVAGIKLTPGARVVFFGAVPSTGSVVVTVASTAGALPGGGTGSVKVAPFEEFPGKGRATQGVRCHRFLKGEDELQLAWAGPTPAIACAGSGAPIDLPPADGRRDGSGHPVPQPILAIGSRTFAVPSSGETHHIAGPAE